MWDRPLRRLAEEALPAARIQVDRGDALYVAFGAADISPAREAGFAVSARGEAWALGLSPRLVGFLDGLLPPKEDRLLTQLKRLPWPPGEADMLLATALIKALEGGQRVENAQRRVRLLAAKCLREKKGGGALALCRRIEMFD